MSWLPQPRHKVPLAGSRQGGSQDGALGWQRRGVTAPPGLGEADVDAAPVQVAQGTLDQPVLFELADQPGQRALAEVHGLGQFLDAELVLLVLGQPLEYLELADPKSVPLAKLTVQGRNDRCVAGGERAPRDHDLRDTPCR